MLNPRYEKLGFWDRNDGILNAVFTTARYNAWKVYPRKNAFTPEECERYKKGYNICRHRKKRIRTIWIVSGLLIYALCLLLSSRDVITLILAALFGILISVVGGIFVAGFFGLIFLLFEKKTPEELFYKEIDKDFRKFLFSRKNHFFKDAWKKERIGLIAIPAMLLMAITGVLHFFILWYQYAENGKINILTAIKNFFGVNDVSDVADVADATDITDAVGASDVGDAAMTATDVSDVSDTVSHVDMADSIDANADLPTDTTEISPLDIDFASLTDVTPTIDGDSSYGGKFAFPADVTPYRDLAVQDGVNIYDSNNNLSMSMSQGVIYDNAHQPIGAYGYDADNGNFQVKDTTGALQYYVDRSGNYYDNAGNYFGSISNEGAISSFTDPEGKMVYRLNLDGAPIVDAESGNFEGSLAASTAGTK